MLQRVDDVHWRWMIVVVTVTVEEGIVDGN